MKVLCPTFRLCHEFSHTSWFGKYKYTTNAKTIVRFDSEITKNPVRCYDRNGKLWGTIHRTYIEIESEYAWNGSSCSPDTEWNSLASLVHDFLFQFSGALEFPLSITLDKANDIFYIICAHNGACKIAVIWRIGLFFCSWARWRTLPRNGEKCTPLTR